jgi:hypothetical protein
VADDKAYSSRANRAHLRRRNIKAVIPEKADQAANRKKKGHFGGRPVSHDATLYKDRNTSSEPSTSSRSGGAGHPLRQDTRELRRRLHLRGSILWLRSLPALP